MLRRDPAWSGGGWMNDLNDCVKVDNSTLSTSTQKEKKYDKMQSRYYFFLIYYYLFLMSFNWNIY